MSKPKRSVIKIEEAQQIAPRPATLSRFNQEQIEGVQRLDPNYCHDLLVAAKEKAVQTGDYKAVLALVRALGVLPHEAATAQEGPLVQQAFFSHPPASGNGAIGVTGVTGIEIRIRFVQVINASNGPVSVQDLARATHVPEDRIRRLLKHVWFEEDSKGWRVTPVGQDEVLGAD